MTVKQRSLTWRLLGIGSLFIGILGMIGYTYNEMCTKPEIRRQIQPIKYTVLENNMLLEAGLGLPLEKRERIRLRIEKVKQFDRR